MVQPLDSVRWKSAFRTFTRFIGILVLFVFVALVLLLSLPKKQNKLLITHDFGIGIDLSPSYGTVAISYPNGSIQAIAKIEGDATYREMMQRLSKPSSKHVHQPYHNVGESLSDISRQQYRGFLKRLGFPASKDVGTLSRMVSALCSNASAFANEPISAATLSIPNLAALYGEDLRDTFEYLSLIYLEVFPFFNHRPIRSTMTAYAGNGRGLCTDYKNATTCGQEENSMESFYALAVSYTHSSLTASLSRMASARFLEETGVAQDLRLGYDARHDNSKEDFYWEMVRDNLAYPVVQSPIPRNISIVLVSGDAAEIPRFRGILDEVVSRVVEGEPELVDRDPTYSAAKGAAELAKRSIFDQRRRDDGLEALLEL